MKKHLWLILFCITSLCFCAVKSFADATTNFTTQATTIDLSNAQLSLTQVEHIIKTVKQSLRGYQEQLQALNMAPQDRNFNFEQSILKTKIQNQINLLQLNEQRRDSLKKIITVFSTQLQNEQQQLQVITEEQQRQAHLAHEKQMQNEIQTLSQEQNYWLNQVSNLNQALDNRTNNTNDYNSILGQIFIAEENSTLTQFKINWLHFNTALQNVFSSINENASVTSLNQQQQELSSTIEDLEQNQTILEQKIKLLQQRKNLLKQNQNPKNFTAEMQIEQFIMQYQALQTNIGNLLIQANLQEEKATKLLAKALAHRQTLPGFSLPQWETLGKNLIQMAIMSYQISVTTLHDIYNDLHQLDGLKKVNLITLPFLALFAYAFIKLICQKIQKKLSPLPNNILHRFIDGAFKIFLSHLWFITLFFLWLIFLNIVNINAQVSNLAWHLGNTILIFSVAHMTARLLLYKNTANQGGDDVKLYHRLCWLFSLGFLTAILLFIAESLNSPYEVQDLFDRLFMLFIFVTALMLLKAWQVVPQLIIPFINPQQSYFIRSVKLLGLILPLIILSNAVIGLIGFVELAWTISKYEGLFLIVVTGFLILRGLSNDLMRLLAGKIVQLHSGWIFIEAFLKPIFIWIQIGLFLLSVYSLLYLYNLNHQAFVINYFYATLHFPVLSFSNKVITVWTLVKASLIALLFIWATKWSREFCYRKLYRNIQDIGARNSLSIFSQYAVFIIGTLFTLKVLKLDFTTLNYILSGLAIGAGFGLRDLANNFISGLLVLVERPMRRGDTVSVGDYEGKVTDIGMRATTLLSSDNREVLVPNSEVFSKIFTNWTHRDDIVRCEAPLKVRWEQDPHKLQHEIEQTMLNTKGVLAKPAPEALLTGMKDGFLEFEIRFYIDYRVNDSRMIMRSQVLFNLWDKFSELGIAPPYPTHLVYVEK